MKARNTILALLAVTCLVFAGCGQSGSDAQSSGDTQEISAAAEMVDETNEAVDAEDADAENADTEDAGTDITAGETEYPLTITDSAGTEITLESEPERVISVAPNLTEIMYDIGAGDKLVGRSDYCDYPEEVLDIASVGSIYDPDIEAIISLEPDVVIVSTLFDEENTAKMQDLGIQVVTLYDNTEMTGVYDMITTLGQIMNCSDTAAQRVEEMKDTIDEVTLTVAGQDKPSVYYVVDYGDYGDFTAGGDTFVGGILDLAGADNIAKDVSGWSITTEQIIESDPYIIIVPEDYKDDFMATSPYSELTAVKEGRVYGIDNNMLDRQGYRNAEAVQTIAEICYPDLFE